MCCMGGISLSLQMYIGWMDVGVQSRDSACHNNGASISRTDQWSKA